MDDGQAESSLRASIEALEKTIQLKTAMNNKLKEIIKNQLKNINELRKKCEDSYVCIDQLPKNQFIFNERFEKTMKLIKILQNKQIEVNALLNVSMKEFDDVTVLTNQAKEQFESEVQLVNQRHMIFEVNLAEVKILGENVINSLRKRNESKTDLLNSIKSFLERNTEQKFSSALSQVNDAIQNTEMKNSEVKNELSQVELALELTTKKMSLLHNTIKVKEINFKEELKTVTFEFDKDKKELCDVLLEIEAVISGNRDLHEQCLSLQHKLPEEAEKSIALSQEILSKRSKLDSLKCDLENALLILHQLHEIAKQVTETEELIILTETHLNDLKFERDNLIKKKENFPSEFKIISDNCEKLKNNINQANEKIEKLKHSYQASKQLVSEARETYNEEKNSFEKKMKEITDAINNLKLKRAATIASNQIKREKFDSMKTLLNGEIEACTRMKNEINEKKEENKRRREELNKRRSEMKEKISNVSQMIEIKKAMLKEKLERKEKLTSLSEKVAFEKNKKRELLQKCAQEKWKLRNKYDEIFEAQLAEHQKMKGEKMKALEHVDDRYSRTLYTHDCLSIRIEQHKVQISNVKKALRTYDCEGELLKRLFGSLDADSSNSSGHCSGEEMVVLEYQRVPTVCYSYKAEEKVGHEFQVPTVDYSLQSSSQIKCPQIPRPLGKRSTVSLMRSTPKPTPSWNPWKRTKKEPTKKTILDKVIDSTDSHSSA